MATQAAAAPSHPRRGVPWPWLKPGVLVGGLIPGVVIVTRAIAGTLSADPIAEALNRFGKLALIFLIASLACTPLKTLFGWTWPRRIRRMLGLFAFGYAAVHVTTYVALDLGFDLRTLGEDIVRRSFILVGFLAFVLLIPLAVTSTNASVRRLGYVRWQRLHRLVYPAALLACVHFIWRVKADELEPIVYTGVLVVLLALRLPVWRRRR